MLLPILFSLSVWAAIFGQDSRSLVLPQSPAAKYSQATAVAVLSGNVVETVDGKFDLDIPQLSESFCAEQKFVMNPSMSYACTGFLVAPDLIATAGHCMVNTGEARNEKDKYCEVYSWLFDYRADSFGKTKTKGLEKGQLYHCKEVIYAVKDEQAPFRDYALVRLDRPVEGRTPYQLQSRVGQNEEVTMLGYPLGLPLIASYDAKILLNDLAKQAFVTNLDAFEGNSGSPVFNGQKEVVGILVGGTPSQSFFADTKKGGCFRYNVCDQLGNNCLLSDENLNLPGIQRVGSDVQRIQPLLDLLNSLPENSP
jgi:V8-like Glu-specific endopeptidase